MVLIGCEYTGTVRDAFIDVGQDAISCDILPSERPGPHHQGDIFDMLDRDWDLIIMFPPCTALCNAGNKHYGRGCDMYYDRLTAVYWTRKLWLTCKMFSKRVCFENPPGVLTSMANMPKPQLIQPYQFGHPEQKRTGLYLHNLPRLKPTKYAYEEMRKLPRHKREAVFYMGPSETRGLDRARTFPGIAAAMATQWS